MTIAWSSIRKIALWVVLAFTSLFLQEGLNTAFAREFLHAFQFPKGEQSTIISGSLIRGDVHKYVIHATTGQKMTVKVNAVEDNAAFQIRSLGDEEFLAGAGEEDDAKSWEGILPSSGKYTIIVRGIRGNATFTLKVAIEPRL